MILKFDKFRRKTEKKLMLIDIIYLYNILLIAFLPSQLKLRNRSFIASNILLLLLFVLFHARFAANLLTGMPKNKKYTDMYVYIYKTGFKVYP